MKYKDSSQQKSLHTLSKKTKNSNQVIPKPVLQNKLPSQLEEELLKLRTYTLFKPIRKNFPRRRYLVRNFRDIWNIDLLQMDKFSRQNKEALSNYAMARPIKRKTAANVLEAFKDIVKIEGYAPKLIHADRGLEFSGVFNNHLKSIGTHLYHTFTDKKAVIVESFNRVLRKKLFAIMEHNRNHVWFPFLQPTIKAHNETENSRHKMRPSDKTKQESQIQYVKYLKREIALETPPDNSLDALAEAIHDTFKSVGEEVLVTMDDKEEYMTFDIKKKFLQFQMPPSMAEYFGISTDFMFTKRTSLYALQNREKLSREHILCCVNLIDYQSYGGAEYPVIRVINIGGGTIKGRFQKTLDPVLYYPLIQQHFQAHWTRTSYISLPYSQAKMKRDVICRDHGCVLQPIPNSSTYNLLSSETFDSDEVKVTPFHTPKRSKAMSHPKFPNRKATTKGLKGKGCSKRVIIQATTTKKKQPTSKSPKKKKSTSPIAIKQKSSKKKNQKPTSSKRSICIMPKIKRTTQLQSNRYTPGYRSAADIFSDIPVENSYKSLDDAEAFPIGSLDGDNPIEFRIVGNNIHSIPASSIKLNLRLRLTKKDGTAVPVASEIGVLLKTGNNSFETSLFELDNKPNKATFDDNTDFKKRADVFASATTVELTGRLNHCVFNIDKLIPKNVTINIKLRRSSQEFVLISEKEIDVKDYKLAILDTTVTYQKVELNEDIENKLQHQYNQNGAKLLVQKDEIKTFSIAPSSLSTISTQLYGKSLPEFIAVAFVPTLNLNEVCPKNKGITKDLYKNGYCVFFFRLQPKRIPGYLYKDKEAQISFEATFSEALSGAINVLLYSETQGLIEIDKFGNIKMMIFQILKYIKGGVFVLFKTRIQEKIHPDKFLTGDFPNCPKDSTVPHKQDENPPSIIIIIMMSTSSKNHSNPRPPKNYK
ncbi:putative uncharacterized transposon-derived protein F54H12.3 [Orchesella cincta]|uniref:Uncharacterized transposon-derived protein F54H12.3 n=1 Tax=Orchesella cincta TaxID=48709 RepID=A0A1D2MH61_ORCCI|nr:putative uncharacterized transposon-derived protein F54H12.3 [Orchesella cincta]